MEEIFVTDRLRLLLDHFGDVGDPRAAAKVEYPPREVLFLVTCATIAGRDDDDEIAAWGALNVGFLSRYSEYFFGVPKADRLRVVLNLIDPALFEACFFSWAAALRPGPDLIALDGKTLRRSGDSAAGQKPGGRRRQGKRVRRDPCDLRTPHPQRGARHHRRHRR